MELNLNYAQALRDELNGLQRRIGAMTVTGDNTGLLELRVKSIREQLGEPAPVDDSPRRNGKARGVEKRPAGTGDTPES
jgi:hypothetical protein